MPGTVQVSILKLTGFPSSKSSSSMSIKVSLGKHTYEAEGDKGEFFFPLATLRDNLVVKVYDTEGNEIAHTGVKSRLIAEKGSWDDLFPLEGGGEVHMRLKFSLSEEERTRIRNMRESALRKKQEERLNHNNKELQAAIASSGGGNEMTSTAAISEKVNSIDLPLAASFKVVSSKSSNTPSNSSASVQVKADDQHYNLEQSPLEKSPSNLKEDDQLYNLKEQTSLEETPSRLKEDDQGYKLKEQSQLVKTPGKVKEDDQCFNLKEQNPLDKTPSKVRETIAAFESSRLIKLVGEEVTSSKDENLSGITKKPESSHSSGDGASRGPNGKVVKAVIMVGFGLLVLFTRKRKSRGRPKKRWMEVIQQDLAMLDISANLARCRDQWRAKIYVADR